MVLHLYQQAEKLFKEQLVLANDASRILVVDHFVFNALNLQLSDVVVDHFMVIDAFIQWALHGDDLELRDAHVEYVGNLSHYLPDLLMIIDDDFVADVIRHKDHCDFLIFRSVVLCNVFDRDVHVVEVLDVGTNESDPVQAHLNVASWFFCRQAIELLGDVFNFLQEVLDEDLAVLLFNVTLQVDLNEEVATFSHHLTILTLNSDRPKCLET